MNSWMDLITIIINLAALQIGTGVIAAACAYKKEDMRDIFIAVATYRSRFVRHKFDNFRYLKYTVAFYAAFILIVGIFSSFK